MGKEEVFLFHGSPRLTWLFFFGLGACCSFPTFRTLLRRKAWSGVAYAELRSDALGSSYEVQFNCEKESWPGPWGNSCSQTSRFWGARFHVRFFRGRIAKTEDSLKTNTRNRKQLDLLFIWKMGPEKPGSPQKNGFPFIYKFFCWVSFSTEPWSMEDTWRIIPGLVCVVKKPWLASPLK